MNGSVEMVCKSTRKIVRDRLLLAGIVAALTSCNQILDLNGNFTKEGTSGSGGAKGTSTGVSGSTSSGVGGAGGAQNRTVTGTEAITYVNFNATGVTTTVVHPDLTNIAIAALAPNGTSFGPPIVGVGALNGTFSIANVPPGPYYLLIRDSQYDGSYFVTSEDSVDMGYYVMGRTDATAATSPTPLTLDVGNLAPWTASDHLQLVAGGSNTFGLDLTIGTVTNPPSNGATSLAMTIDSSKLLSPNLIESASGDFAGLLQLTPQTTPVAYEALTRFIVLPTLNQTNGMSSAAMTTFATVQLLSNAALSWNTTAFEAELSQVNKHAIVARHQFTIQSELGDPSFGIYSLTPTIVLYLPPVGGQDVSVTLPFGNPISSPPWYTYETTQTTYSLSQSTPGGAVTPSAVSSTYIAPRATFEAAEPLVPQITPPTSPSLDGQSDFFEDGALGSLQPTVSWKAPSVGAPTKYTVKVTNLSAAGKRTIVGTIVTDGTSVTVPPGIMTSGSYYVFSIQATTLNGVTFEKTPTRETLPLAQAVTFSGVKAAP